MIATGPARFFFTLGVQPAYAFLALVALLGIALLTVALDPGQLDGGLAMILFVQMFLASTGFLSRARRGHFDPILVNRRTRAPVMAAHFLVSVLPGLIAWVVLAAAATLAGNRGGIDALIGSRAAALVIVSALSWSVGFFLPRGAAGLLWVGVILVGVIRGPDFRSLVIGSRGLAGAVFGTITCPFMLLGIRPVSPAAAAIGAVASAVVLVGVCWFAERLDCSLVDYSS